VAVAHTSRDTNSAPQPCIESAALAVVGGLVGTIATQGLGQCTWFDARRRVRPVPPFDGGENEVTELGSASSVAVVRVGQFGKVVTNSPCNRQAELEAAPIQVSIFLTCKCGHENRFALPP
jgi:hypothetical protein